MKRDKQPHTDPFTGDTLTGGEYISWKVQGIIRRWTFLILITAITALVWFTNEPTALLWWNLGASYLALFIESIVGLSMFQQTRRDAIALRETRTISRHSEQQLAHIEQIAARLEKLEAQLDLHINTTAQEHLAEIRAVKTLAQEMHRYTREVHEHTYCTGHTIITGAAEQAA